VLKKDIALSEVDKWDLEDIDNMNALLDMEVDYEIALDGYREKQRDK